MNTSQHEAHRAFLNRYYAWSKPVYDLTRKYYLFGRDPVLQALGEEDWNGLVEIGPGTGRNLSILRGLKPHAHLGGVDACDEMLDMARARLPDATFTHGFAESATYGDLLDVPVDRVLFSYSLSMIQDRVGALARAREALSPGGEVVVVDFGDLEGLPSRVAKVLRQWLRTFHVEPLEPQWLRDQGADVTLGPAHYYVVARFRA